MKFFHSFPENTMMMKNNCGCGYIEPAYYKD